VAPDDDAEEEEDTSEPIERRRINGVRTLAWVFLIGASIYLFGHVAGLTIALVVVFRYFSELSWPRAVVYAAVNVAFLVVLFQFAFNARLYSGIVLG